MTAAFFITLWAVLAASIYGVKNGKTISITEPSTRAVRVQSSDCRESSRPKTRDEMSERREPNKMRKR